MISFKYIGSRVMPLVIITLILITGCNKNKEPQLAETIAKKISEDPNLSMFKAAVAKAKLEAFTDGPGPFTVFAPDNNAFKAVGIHTEADLNKIDSNALVTLLTYHITSSRRLSLEIPAGPNAPITTQLGFSLFASKNTNGIFLNGTKVLSADIECANGILHTVNRLLVPPTLNIVNYLGTLTNHRLLALAVSKANLTLTTFNPTTAAAITVFAPTNAAFIAAGLDSTAIANANITTLGNILKYHIVTGRLYGSDMKADSIKTVQGPKALITLTNGSKIRGIKNGGPSSIVEFDINASNGVVHSIDSVLRF